MKKYTHTDELPYTLSVEKLAAFLGISRVGAYNLAHAKGFPTLRVGKRILVPPGPVPPVDGPADGGVTYGQTNDVLCNGGPVRRPPLPHG